MKKEKHHKNSSRMQTQKKNFNQKKSFNEVYLVLAVALLIIAVSYFTRQPSTHNAEKITELIIDHHELSFATGGVIDNEKLENIKNMDYSELKESLNAGSDFCMYIEDENGNLIIAKASAKFERDETFCR